MCGVDAALAVAADSGGDRACRAVCGGKGEYPFGDAEFVEAFGARGKPGWSPGRLVLVMVLQMAENLTDRGAAHRVRFGMDWKYALGRELDDPGFDASIFQ